ncbi:MAG: nuclear transport factor 2 family protein [Chloroflexi bacterium]|nr:nuclear transport factor 2 family protein [Chloroflexota bacterium]
MAATTTEYETPLGIPNANLDGDAGRGYYSFTIDAPDELYLGNRFNGSVTFGSGVNEINRLFANGRTVGGSPNPNNGHYDTWGWTKMYDSGDGTVGCIVYMKPGETNDRTFAHQPINRPLKTALCGRRWPMNPSLKPQNLFIYRWCYGRKQFYSVANCNQPQLYKQRKYYRISLQHNTKGTNIMKPVDIVRKWIERFNVADIDGLIALYAEDAVHHQVVAATSINSLFSEFKTFQFPMSI